MVLSTFILVQAFFQIVYCAAEPYNVTAVKQVMIKNAAASWELGTASEALLELDNTDLSVFGHHAFISASAETEALAYAKPHIALSSDLLIADATSNSDPASLGVAAIMLGKTISAYSTAAVNQLNTLLYHTPKASNGAISHRSQSIELW